MKKLFLLTILMISVWLVNGAEQLSVHSPDGRIQVSVKLTDRIYYDLQVDGQEVMWFSPVSMNTDKGVLGQNPHLLKQTTRSEDEIIQTAWGIRSKVPNQYNELELTFDGGYALLFRVYNDGVAYRFKTNLKGELTVYDEEVEYRFWEDYPMINLVTNSFNTYECLYTRQSISQVKAENMIGLPSVIRAGDFLLSVMESDLYDYPGMHLSKKINSNRFYLNGKFARYPTAWEQRSFSLRVTEEADCIAKTTGQRNFPWRVLAISQNDKELANSDLVYKLARPSTIETGWIKPGKVAWDWWNAMNLDGVNFKTGINNKTYEYFIDFAARNGIDYVIMDEGWSDQFDVLLPTPLVDMEHLTDYARRKGVKLILWGVWHTIDRQYNEAFALFEKWGIAGVKIDFIDRDDQLAIEFYERMAKAAAEHHLLVDFHGCSKPTGLHRTYPNVVNFEAVKGNEFNKVSDEISPGHNVDIAFIRMMAGPMDYTPGAMTNSVRDDFHKSFENPMSQGTRCHQLGMYVVYYAPLQMMCDAPTAYEQYPDILKFLAKVPVTWDDTKVLDGKLGEYVIIARKKGNDWYIGGINNWDEREVELDLSSILDSDYKAEIFQDGINANRKAGDYQFFEQHVSKNGKLKINMKQGGGFAIKLTRMM